MIAPTGATWTGALTVGVLFTAGTYLILQRQLTRVVLGFGLLTHGANVLLLLAGGYAAAPAFAGEDRRIADPLPQAFALTAIVISLAVTALLLGLAHRASTTGEDDAVMDDVEDRRVAHDEGGPE